MAHYTLAAPTSDENFPPLIAPSSTGTSAYDTGGFSGEPQGGTTGPFTQTVFALAANVAADAGFSATWGPY